MAERRRWPPKRGVWVARREMDLAGMKRRDLQALCKRHGLPAGGTNAALVAQLADAAVLPEASGAGDKVVARKGCLKRQAGGNDLREAKKVSFALESSRGRRRQSQVFSSPPAVAKTRGRSKAAPETRPAGRPGAEAGRRGRGQQMRAEAVVGSAADEDSVTAEAGVPVRRSRRNSVSLGDVEAAEAGEGAPVKRSRRNSVSLGDVKAAEAGEGAPVRRSRRNSVSLGDVEAAEAGKGAPVRRSRRNSVSLGDVEAAAVGSGAPLRRSRRNSLGLSDVKAVEAGEAVDVDRKQKRKRKGLGKEEETAVNPQVGVPCRVTRRSSLPGAAVLSPLAVEKKRGRRKAAGPKNELDVEEQVAEAQDLAEAALPAVVESKRSVRKAENCEPAVQKSAKIEAPVRIIRSRSAAATVIAPIVVENKRRRITEDVQPDVELRPVLEVPRNDAPVTRTLRKRAVQVNSCVVEENKRQSGRTATRQSKQLASSMEEEDPKQVAAPNNCLPLRRSGRNNSEASSADSETNRLSSMPVEVTNAKGEDVVKQPAIKEPVRRSTRKSIVSALLDEEDKNLVAERSPEHVRRSKRKSFVLAKDSKGDGDETQNPKSKDMAKQPATNEPVRLSTRKSIVSVVLEEEDKDLIAEKSPEAHVRKLKRKSVAPVKDSKGVGEETHNAKDKDLGKQAAVKEPVRRSTRKSIASAVLEEEGKDLIAEKSPVAHVRKLKCKSAVPVKDSKGVGEETQNAKAKDVKQAAVKEPVRRSTRKSIVSAVLEEEGKDLIAEKSPEEHVRISKRKLVAPVKDSKGVGKETQNSKGKDVAKQAAVKEPVRRSTRKSIVSAVLEEEDKNLIAEKSPQVHVRTLKWKSVVPVKDSKGVQNSLHRSTHKSLNCNLSDDTHSGPNKPISSEKASAEVLKLRKHRRSSVEMSSPANDPCNVVDFGGQKFRKQSNTQTPNEIDSTGTNCEKPTSKAKSAKRRRTTVPEEVVSVEEAKCEGMVIREATRDAVTHGNGSSSRIQEICQVNATGKEVSSSLSPATFHEECIVQTLHNVICGSESADAQNTEIYPSHGRESSDTSKQTQEYYNIEIDDGLLSETRIEGLVQSSSITGVPPHNGIVSEDKTLRDGGEVNFGDKSIQIVNASSGEVGLETLNTSFSRSTTAVLIVDEAPMVESTTVNAETKQSDAEVVPTVLSCCDGITVTVSTPQFDGQKDKDSQAVSTDASECAPPISDSKQESQSVEQSIQGADMGKCSSKGIKGNPLSPNLRSDGADADSIFPALDAAKGSSTGGSHSSFGLDSLFVEKHNGSSSRNDRDTVVEVDYGSKPSACVTPSFCTKSDCGVECENIQPLGNDADKTLDVGQGVAQEETIAEKSNDECVSAKFDLKTKLNYEAVGHYVESNHILAEKNTGLVAESRDDEQAVIQVQQGAIHEGTLEMLSFCSAAPECKHLCRLPEEAELHSIGKKRCSSHAEQSPLGLQSLFSQESFDDSMEHGALASATSHTEIGVNQLKYCHVKCTVEKTTVSQPISNHDTQLVTEIGDCMHMSQQDNGIEGLPEVSHEGVLVTSYLSGFSMDANHRKEVINSAELGCKFEENNFFHSEDLNASREKSDVNLSVDSACGISGTESGCSLHAPDAYNDDVRLGSNLAQLESADLLDELIGSFNTEFQHPSQKAHCIEDRENQVASRPCMNDITEATTAKCLESGVVLLPAEGSENLKDSQLKSKMKSTQAVESGCNCNKDISNTSDDGSVEVSERNSPGFTLPKDYPVDHYLQCELLDDFSVEKSLEESVMSGGKNVSNAGIVGNPSFDSAISECKGDSFEELVHRMNNFVGTCPPSPKELLLELQSMSSKENIKESSMLESAKDVESSPSCNKDTRDILDNGSAATVVYEKFLFGDKSDSRMNPMNNYVDTCSSDPRELLMDLQSSSDEDLDPSDNLAFPNTEKDEGPSQDFSRDEGKQDCMSVSLHDDEEFLKSNHLKDTSEDGHHIERDIIAEEVICEEKKERESMRSSNCDILHENSHSKGCGISQSDDWMHIDEINSKLSSCDADILHQDDVEECHKVNEDEVTPAVLEKDMSEATPFKRVESKIMLDGEGEEYSCSRDKGMGEIFYTGSAIPDKQLNTKLKDPEMEKSNCVIDKDTSSLLDTELAGKSKASNLSNDTQLNPSS